MTVAAYLLHHEGGSVSANRKRMTVHQVVQYVNAGRGFLITRQSATLADTDYEHIAVEITRKMNAYPKLVEALAQSVAYMIANPATSLHETQRIVLLTAFGDLQRELGEAS